MRSQNQVMMVALAIVFSIALALTVAMICLSAMQNDESPSDESRTLLPTPGTSNEFSGGTTTAQTELITPPADTDDGLLYRSNGNGTCSLIGIGSCRDAFVVIPSYAPSGDLVTTIAPQALMGCQTVTAIQIPETVTEIGSLAFAACPNLIYISVSDRNPFYCDMEGVLYSADGKTLILYPPLRAGSSLFLPASVTRIEDMAFYQCIYLTSIRYGGSASQWEMISIGSKNYSLTAASVVYSAKESVV